MYEKAYKEALNLAKELVSKGKLSQEEAEKMFPELAESEDEKIRKAHFCWVLPCVRHYSWSFLHSLFHLLFMPTLWIDCKLFPLIIILNYFRSSFP